VVIATQAGPFDETTAWGELHHLVVESFRSSGRWRCWTPDRIDGLLRRHLHAELRGADDGWRAAIRLWRSARGEVVAAVHDEGPEEAYLEVLPGWEALEPELLAWSESEWLRRRRRTRAASAARLRGSRRSALASSSRSAPIPTIGVAGWPAR
jgi:hypothetical protein